MVKVCGLYFIQATLGGISLEMATGANKQGPAGEYCQVQLSVQEVLAGQWAGAHESRVSHSVCKGQVDTGAWVQALRL